MTTIFLVFPRERHPHLLPSSNSSQIGFLVSKDAQFSDQKIAFRYVSRPGYADGHWWPMWPISGEDKASKEGKRCIFEYKHETCHDCSLGWLITFWLKFQKIPSPNYSLLNLISIYS